MTDEYKELRDALAAGPTPGRWERNRHGAILGGPVMEYTNGSGRNQILMAVQAEWMRPGEREANEKFVSAAHPGVVFKLLSDNDRMSELLACAYQLAGAVDAPERFLNAFSRQEGSIDTLLPIDPDECGAVAQPKMQHEAAAEDSNRLEWLVRHLPGNVLRDLIGELGHTGNLEEVRERIDSAIEIESVRRMREGL